jgi:hypothetical protein
MNIICITIVIEEWIVILISSLHISEVEFRLQGLLSNPIFSLFHHKILRKMEETLLLEQSLFAIATAQTQLSA